MKFSHLAAGGAVACLLGVTAAHANDINEDGAWQFRTPAATQVLQNSYSLINQRRTEASALAGFGGVSGLSGGGLLSSPTSATNNQSMVENVNTNSITCSGSAPCTVTIANAGSTTSNNQTTSNSPDTVSNSNTGNTLTSTPVSTINNNSNSGSGAITSTLNGGGTVNGGSSTSGSH